LHSFQRLWPRIVSSGKPSKINFMQQDTHILKDYSDQEKTAYIASIASIATADREATEEEIEFIQALADTAGLSPADEQGVLQSARDTTNASLPQHLSILKNSNLRFSLITDIISFAKADGHYTPQEEAKIKGIASYLNINETQFSTLNHVVDHAATAGKNGHDITGQGFLDSSSIGNKLQESGISSGFMKGALAFIAPVIMSRMMGRSRTSMGGMGGGLLGGLLGGMGGGMMGGIGSRGGLGSIFSTLAGGRSYGSQGGFGSMLGGLGGLFGGGRGTF
jgi:uncharacterized tellurite resistance protein B-like protein